MDRTLLSKVFVLVSCFACASHHQIVASGDAPEPAPGTASESECTFTFTSEPEPDPAKNGRSVLFSAELFHSKESVVRENFPNGDGSFQVFRDEAVEHYFYAHHYMTTPRLNPSMIDLPVVVREGDAFAFRDVWDSDATDVVLSLTDPRTKNRDRCEGVTRRQIYRIDIDALIIDKAKIDYIMSKIGELPAEGLGPISIPPISEQPDGPKTPPHLVNRCIFRVPANASIRLGAFSGNHAIRELRLSPPSTNAPATPPSIEECAFFQCACLQYVEIPDGTPSISRDAFSGCEYLVRVAMPGSVERIDEAAFFGCRNFNMIIPDTVKCIGYKAFHSCKRLDTPLPSQLTHLEQSAFVHTGLRKVTIPVNITKIHSMTFEHCKYLEAVDIHGNVSRIELRAFGACKRLERIDIPRRVKSIGDDAFANCPMLGSVTFEGDSKLETIGRGAFSNCDCLSEIEIPASVTHLKSRAFENCALRSVKFKTGSRLVDIDEETFAGCGELLQINIPNTVMTIRNSAFANCSQLFCVSIGDGSKLSTLGYVFFNCSPELTISIPSSIRGLFTDDRLIIRKPRILARLEVR